MQKPFISLVTTLVEQIGSASRESSGGPNPQRADVEIMSAPRNDTRTQKPPPAISRTAQREVPTVFMGIPVGSRDEKWISFSFFSLEHVQRKRSRWLWWSFPGHLYTICLKHSSKIARLSVQFEGCTIAGLIWADWVFLFLPCGFYLWSISVLLANEIKKVCCKTRQLVDLE